MDKLIEMECTHAIDKDTPKKGVLIFRKDGMGDYIIFYPFLKYFRKYFKDKKVTLVLPKIASSLKPLLEDFDEIIEFDAKRFSRNFLYRRSFIKTLANKNFEIAIYPVFSRENIGDLIIKLTGANKKIGFAKIKETNGIYTDTIHVPPNMRSELERNAIFTKQITGKEPEVNFPTIDLGKFDSNEAKILSGQYKLLAQKYAIIFPGSGAHYKIWPEDRFAAVCDHLITRGITPVICGGPNDTEITNILANKIINKQKIINISGQTSIATLAHILHNSLFYFGSDTGILHLAAAINVPTVCILGGDSLGRFFPYGDPLKNRYVYDESMPCESDDWSCAKHCSGDERAPCIMGISVKNALSVIDGLIAHLTEHTI